MEINEINADTILMLIFDYFMDLLHLCYDYVAWIILIK